MVTIDDIIVDTIDVRDVEQYVSVSFGMQDRDDNLHWVRGYMSAEQAHELQRKLEPYTYREGQDPCAGDEGVA